MSKHEELTQQYSTWGDKLLQHTDILNSIQNKRQFVPITIQIALAEVCDSDCPFCSVAGRPLKSYIPFKTLEKMLIDFKTLGAKSVELTGGGNPLLYRDREENKNINDVIDLAHSMGYDIGIITNSHNLKKHLDPRVYDKIKWLRVSLIQLDEGRKPEDYNFNGLPYTKLGFSYIIYEPRLDSSGSLMADPLSRTNKVYAGTSAETIDKISQLIELHPDVKFVRIAGDCLIKGNNAVVRERWKEVIDRVDVHGKIFIKDIGENDSPFVHGCYVGLVRPYIAPSPHGGEYQVYICTSHVLQTRTYDLNYSLGPVSDILNIWDSCNTRFKELGYPYEVKCNGGKNWQATCKFCYYKFNNQLLHTVANEMPDKNFP